MKIQSLTAVQRRIRLVTRLVVGGALAIVCGLAIAATDKPADKPAEKSKASGDLVECATGVRWAGRHLPVAHVHQHFVAEHPAAARVEGVDPQWPVRRWSKPGGS